MSMQRTIPDAIRSAPGSGRQKDATIATDNAVRVHDWRSGGAIDEVLLIDGAATVSASTAGMTTPQKATSTSTGSTTTTTAPLVDFDSHASRCGAPRDLLDEVSWLKTSVTNSPAL